MRGPAAVYDARKYREWNEAEGGRWITYCHIHGEFVQHETRALAYAFRPYPREWCEGHMAEMEAERLQTGLTESSPRPETGTGNT